MGIIDRAKAFGKGIKDKINSAIETKRTNKEQENLIEDAFRKNSRYTEFTVCFVNGKSRKFGGLLFIEEKKIHLDSDINKNDIKKIIDKKGNEYYIEYINPNKVSFTYKLNEGTFDEIPLEKKLDEIRFTNQKQKEDQQPIYNQTTYNIKNDNHSTNYRGIKNSNINSQDTKVDNKKEVCVDVSANLTHKKGE